MRIKKFTGSTAKEAVDKMREEFGEDAVVLNTRRVTKGNLLSIGAGEYVEVTAAFDEAPMNTPQPRPQLSADEAQGPEVLGSLRELASRFSERTPSGEQRKTPDQFRRYSHPGIARSASFVESDILKQELSEVKSALGEIAHHIKHSKTPVLSVALQKVYLSLIENEVDEEIALEVVETCNHNLSGPQLDDPAVVDKAVTGIITRRFVEVPARRQERKSYVVSLVGPTGVGKTTTIAKLASVDKLLRGKSVAIITADTYRIGAIDQLRAFAEIASIPLSIVYTLEEMISAVKEYSLYDIIYVDTVGRSQRSAEKIVELGKFTDAANSDEVHLVLSANLSLATMRDIYQKFKPVEPNRLLITKIDESVSLGPLLSLEKESMLPFSYITDGQSVPEDIEPASGVRLAKLIFPSESAAYKEENAKWLPTGVLNA